MQEKIKWYQEVLELEPGSKVFFPLARLLAESGQIDDALHTLQHGLLRHPEFIEARLYLIDLLFKNDRAPQCDAQVAQLTELFSNYSGFWEAWGAYFANSGQGKDVALALTFLAASFQRNDLTLAEIFSQGLQAVRTAEVPAPEVPGPEQVEPVQAEPEQVEPEQAEPEQAEPEQGAPEQSESPEAGEAPASLPTVPPLAELVQSLPPTDAPAALAETDTDDGDENEEHFSLRTRSMAEVLAEQGDFKNALDIYQELLQAAASPEETLDLQHRISTLTTRLGAVQGQNPDTPPLPPTAQGKHRLLSLLETLAVRFEAHAQG